MSFQTFLEKHERRRSQKHTHTHFGQYVKPLSIGSEEHSVFMDAYFKYISEHEDNFIGLNAISEKIQPVFPLFFDIDFDVEWFQSRIIEKNELGTYVDEIRTFIRLLVTKTFGAEHAEEIVAKRLSYKLHIHYPKILVTKKQAIVLWTSIVKHMTTTYPDIKVQNGGRVINLWTKAIDKSVYGTGLRMLYSHKGSITKGTERDIHVAIFTNEPYYNSYAVCDSMLIRLKPSLEHLKLTSIKCPVDSQHMEFIDTSMLNINDEMITTVQKKLENTHLRENPSRSQDVEQGQDVHMTEDIKNVLFNFLDSKLAEKASIVTNYTKIKRLPNTGYIAIELSPIDCPFKRGPHTRTSERNVTALWVLLTPKDATLRCFKCSNESTLLDDTPEVLQEKLFDLTNEERLATKCIFSQTHESVTEYIFCKLKDKHAASPYGVKGTSFRWFYYSERKHRWVEEEKIISQIMNEKGPIQSNLYSYTRKLVEREDEPKKKDELIGVWKKLQRSLQTWAFVHGSILPLLARKFHMYSVKNNKPFAEQLDDNPRLMGFTNGVFDFGKRTFRPGKPEDMISKSTNIRYRTYAEFSLEERGDMESSLRKVFPDDKEYHYVIQEMSTCLDGTPTSQRFFILTGYGSNGKSTIVRLINLALGDYAGEVDVTLFTKPRPPSSNPTEDLMSLRGKRFVFCNEPNSKDSLYLGTIKWLTGGDRITGRGIFEKQQCFYPQCTIFMLTNEIPQIQTSQQDYGTWRRIRPWVFSSKFVYYEPTQPNEFKVDLDIEEKMKSWKELFMSLLVHYFLSYQEYPVPEKFKALEKHLRTKNDIYNRFVNEYIKKKTDLITDCSVVYKYFTDWVRYFKIARDVPYDVFERQMIPLLGKPDEKDGRKVWQVEIINAIIV